MKDNLVTINEREYIVHGDAQLDGIDDTILEALGYAAAHRLGATPTEVFGRLDMANLWVARPPKPMPFTHQDYGVIVFFDRLEEARYFMGASHTTEAAYTRTLTVIAYLDFKPSAHSQHQSPLALGLIYTADVNGDGRTEFGIQPEPNYLDDAWIRGILKIEDMADRTPVLDSSTLPTPTTLAEVHRRIANRFSFEKVGAARSVRAHAVDSQGEHFLYLYSDDPMSINDAITSAVRRGLRLRSYSSDRGPVFSYSKSGQGRYQANLTLDPVGPQPPEPPVPAPQTSDDDHAGLIKHIQKVYGKEAAMGIYWVMDMQTRVIETDTTRRDVAISISEYMLRHGYSLVYTHQYPAPSHNGGTQFAAAFLKLEA